MDTGAGDRFRIDQSQAVLDGLKALLALARMLGRLGDVTADLRQIKEQLETDPLAWGDPSRRYRQLGLVECRGMGQHLLVHYAVSEEHRLVYVRGFHPMPGGVLDVGQG